ncbi:hypothetical protein cypCar_00014002 [Cyprinus carpio]|nr:hypothetical protein cypCar_00014002 [Cyprinus carpio]
MGVVRHGCFGPRGVDGEEVMAVFREDVKQKNCCTGASLMPVCLQETVRMPSIPVSVASRTRRSSAWIGDMRQKSREPNAVCCRDCGESASILSALLGTGRSSAWIGNIDPKTHRVRCLPMQVEPSPALRPRQTWRMLPG